MTLKYIYIQNKLNKYRHTHTLTHSLSSYLFNLVWFIFWLRTVAVVVVVITTCGHLGFLIISWLVGRLNGLLYQGSMSPLYTKFFLIPDVISFRCLYSTLPEKHSNKQTNTQRHTEEEESLKRCGCDHSNMTRRRVFVCVCVCVHILCILEPNKQTNNQNEKWNLKWYNFFFESIRIISLQYFFCWKFFFLLSTTTTTTQNDQRASSD